MGEVRCIISINGGPMTEQIGSLQTQYRASGAVAGAARKVLGILEAGLGFACAVLLAILLLSVIVSVGLRYGLGTGLLGSDELAIWLHVTLIGLGAPLAIKGSLAMRFDAVVSILPPRAQTLAAATSSGVTLLAGLLLASGGLEAIIRLGGISTALALPEWLRFIGPSLGGGLIVAMTVLEHLARASWPRLVGAIVIAAGLLILPHALVSSVCLPPSAIAALIGLMGLLVAAPLAHALLVACWLAVPFGSPLTEAVIVSTTIGGVSKFLLLAVPFFLLAGGLFSLSNLAEQMVRLAASLVGHFRGGVAQTALLSSILFSGASGSSVANAAFGATSFAPSLIRKGHTPAQAGAVIAAASVIDNVIPPSIALLILAAATDLSVGKLLVGGFFAGILMAGALAISIRCTARAMLPAARATTAERWRATREALPSLGLIGVVLVGIRLGLMTPTEASAAACLYTLIACIACRTGSRIVAVALREAAIGAAAVGLLIGSATPFAFLLATDNIGALVAQLLQWTGSSPIMILLLANLVLLIVGMVLDIGAAIVLFGPLLLPLAAQSGLDPIQFGVLIVVNLMIGGLTPPVGMLVYVVAGTMQISAASIFRAVWPHIAALLGALALISAIAWF